MDNLRNQLQSYVKSEKGIYHNAKARIFPRLDLIKNTYCSKPLFREAGWEESDTDQKNYEKMMKNALERENGPAGEEVELVNERCRMGESVREDNIRRAKTRIFEYAMLNEFEYFITWTLDAKRINRYDADEVAEKMQAFLRNKVQRNNLRYIIVPELHKDGAIHAHGFVSGNLTMTPAKLKNGNTRRDKSGRTIYNVKDWRYGFSTAVRISGDYQKACYYITKYIEKADKMVFGNFYYAGGHGLIREPETHLFDVEFDVIDVQEYEVEAANASFKYEDIKDGETVLRKHIKKGGEIAKST